jgi:hypothetical protein
LQGCTAPLAADARVTIYPEGLHDAWTRTYNGTAGFDVFEWLLSHTKR